MHIIEQLIKRAARLLIQREILNYTSSWWAKEETYWFNLGRYGLFICISLNIHIFIYIKHGASTNNHRSLTQIMYILNTIETNKDFQSLISIHN